MPTPIDPLRPGDPAPPFVARTWQNEPVSLDAYREGKLWLAFFRHVNCPFCNIRIHEMRDLHDELAGKVEIVAVFQSPASKFESGIATKKAWYPMVSDPEEALYRLYRVGAGMQAVLSLELGPALVTAAKQGLWPMPHHGTFTRAPADFLIDRGIIRRAFYAQHIAEHIPLSEVQAFATTALHASPG